MCGIVGIYNFKNKEPLNSDILYKMRDTMVHRGPDGGGLWVSRDGQIGLGHRRLSIIDLSESANQPMCNEDGTVWIVFNGEIYNHAEIRPELEACGHRFKTDHSDTEVIIHAFEEWGKECVHRFRGMFAFVIYNDREKELWLFRDRIGIKPLYYTFQNGKFLFASEIKAILTHPDVRRTVDEKAFYHYLSFLCTPCPDTLFEGIKKLSPGCCGRVSRDGRMEETRYWDVWDHTNPMTSLSEDDIAERLLDELRKAVNYRKVSDVPVGIFLSGGLDSSANAALFSENDTNSVKTFSIGYDGEYQSYQNEFHYAQMMARLVKSEHHELRLTEDDLIGFLQKLVYHQDEPLADPVCVPVYFVSKLARDNNVIVCQAGEGSDELFCGYPHWINSVRLQNLGNMPFVKTLSTAGLAILKILGKEDKKKYECIRRMSANEPVFWGGAETFTEGQKKRLLSQRLRRKFQTYSSYEALKPVWDRFNDKAWEKTPLNWMSYLDLNLRLPELLLMRIDKMSMAVSLEARVPFLDHYIVELAMSVPGSVKTRNSELKHILKKSVRGLIPDEIINRKKQGFSVPVFDWLFKRLGNYTQDKLFKFTERTDYFDASYIRSLVTNNDIRLWSLLNFVLWHEKWIEGEI